MEQVVMYSGWFRSETDIPVVDRMVRASELLPEPFQTALAVFIRYNGVVYLANYTMTVPKNNEVVKNVKGQICGIPAVRCGGTLLSYV